MRQLDHVTLSGKLDEAMASLVVAFRLKCNFAVNEQSIRSKTGQVVFSVPVFFFLCQYKYFCRHVLFCHIWSLLGLNFNKTDVFAKSN